MSFGEIGKILKKFKKEAERERGHTDEEEIDNNEPKSKQSQAFKLFSESKTPVQVVIALDTQADEVHAIYREYLELKALEHNVAFRKPSNVTTENPKALVFTHYRDTARKVVEILTENGIKASRFVGQAKRELDIGMSQEEQSAVLESFRNGEFDVLVATSIDVFIG